MAMIYDLDNEYGGYIVGDGGEKSTGTLEVKSGAAGTPALSLSRTVAGSQTVASLMIRGSSVASGALISFGGGFISVTSILGIAATGAALGFSKVLPVADANGNMYGIPLTSLASLTGAAAF
jgi:hypothetical protein